MGRVIFINPFDSTRISGGIKSTYQHAELLTELGYRVTVFQPAGPPNWCSPHLRALVSDRLDPAAGDILVFPETLNGWLADYAKAPNPATKIMFCQNQFYLISYGIDAQGFRERQFVQFIVPSEVARRTLETVIGLSTSSSFRISSTRRNSVRATTRLRRSSPCRGNSPTTAASRRRRI